MSSGSGLESHVHAHHARVAVDHETGADQEDQRHCYFDDDQRAAQSLTNAAPAASRRLLERFLQVRARDAQSRKHAGKYPRRHRHSEREEQHGRSDRDVLRRRIESGRERNEQPDPDIRHDNSERAADEREQHVLGQELADHAPTAGAERNARRHFGLARHASAQLKIRHVDRGDQQHEPDGAEKKVQRVLVVGGEHFVQRLQADSPIRGVGAACRGRLDVGG